MHIIEHEKSESLLPRLGRCATGPALCYDNVDRRTFSLLLYHPAIKHVAAMLQEMDPWLTEA
jgi:hypothetical protein